MLTAHNAMLYVRQSWQHGIRPQAQMLVEFLQMYARAKFYLKSAF
jgi:hypothetical protein